MSNEKHSSKNEPIAIVGMACIFPGAPSVVRFWENLVNGVDAIRDAGPAEWNADYYKSKSTSSFGNIYCTRGGFISEYAEFDPLEFGIMPSSIHGADPDQYLVLRAAAEALSDAGYHHKTFDGDRAEIILGRTMASGVGQINLIQHGQTIDQVVEILKVVCPQIEPDQLEQVAQKLRSGLLPCNADTIPGIMPNVMTGRIANKLGCRGRNLVLDAACASSLLAVETAIMGLESGQSDLAIAGGVHVNSTPCFYQMFSGLGALSQSGTIRPFDDNADGTVIGEGVGMVVLKRVDDAIRDGNRIYAVIRGVGSSSDGRSGGLLAPNVDGEVLAMQRAYEKAGVSPKTIELLEAHGTGTRVGDRAEMNAIARVFRDDDRDQTTVSEPWCAIGSVKSMIGHTQAASGIAGIIKAALALHHKVLPATLNVVKPNTQVDWSQSPCFINTKSKPWMSNDGMEQAHPRRAAVSAFGFGGINAHVILEEHCDSEADRALRIAQPKPETTTKAHKDSVKLALKFPGLRAELLQSLQVSPTNIPVSEIVSNANANANANAPVGFGQRQNALTETVVPPQLRPMPVVPKANAASDLAGTQGGDSQVLCTFVQTMNSVHQQMLGVQENVMLAYLKTPSRPRETK